MDVAVGTIMACNFILIHKSRNKPGKAGILIPKSHFFSLGTSSENSSRKTWPSLALHGRVCARACHGLSKAASPKKSLWRGQCDLKLFNNSLAQWVLLKLWFYRSWDPGPASQASTLLRALAVRTGVSDREGTRQALSRNSPEKGAAVMSCALLLAQHPLLPLRMTQHWPWLLLCRRKSACLRAGWMST